MREVDAFHCSPMLQRSICFVCVFGCHQILQSWDYQFWDARTTSYWAAMTSDDWMTDCVSTSLHSADVWCHLVTRITWEHLHRFLRPNHQSTKLCLIIICLANALQINLSLLCSVLCWLLSASQFLFGCQFKCLTLAGIIVACHGRASDPSLTWSLARRHSAVGTRHRGVRPQTWSVSAQMQQRGPQVSCILCQSKSFPKLL